MPIKSLLTPKDFVLTDGKTLVVVESAEEATKQQELMAYDKPGQPIYLLTLASVALITKKDAKSIKKALKAQPVATQPASNAELFTALAELAEAQGNNNVH